jgi:hypothetical protein
MNGSQLEHDDRLKRHERLRYLHEILVQLVMHEGRFISERANIFLLFNSILFTVFTSINSNGQLQCLDYCP